MHILFVCTGNLCRSPLAEVALRKILEGAGLEDVQVSSAGVRTRRGLSPPEEAIQAAREMGLDLSTHLSQTLSAELMGSADRVLVMAPEHEEALRALFPSLAHRVERLSAYLPEGEGPSIPDPLGYPLEVYRKCYAQIERAVRAFYEKELSATSGEGRGT